MQQTHRLLVASGGTVPTLSGIKQSTKDVDFVVEAGSMADMSLSSVPLISWTDLFSTDMIFYRSLPTDYMPETKHVGTFGRMRLYAANPLDVVMIKIARADGKDMDDIRAYIRPAI